jgi:cell filamentation protein
MTDDPYVHPGTAVLRNKLGLIDNEQLNRQERIITAVRARQGVPTGDFDLKHLQAIHHHLFQG